jgi:murein L,D-transpeptidase YafK
LRLAPAIIEAAVATQPPSLFFGAMMREVPAMSGNRLGKLGALVFSALFAGEAAAQKADLVRVDKSDRRMELVGDGVVLRTYYIALGANPEGHKKQEGDERTPEGRYILDWRNPKSAFTRSIHVSYPNQEDKKRARQAGVSPGGDIMIHGQPKGYGWWAWLFQMFDWTNGCLAVTDDEMKEIWDMVADGTPIEINP